MKQTAMQDLREDLILTQEKVNDSLQIHNKEIREACQEVVRLTLSNIIKRIDEELLEMEKQQKGYSEEEVEIIITKLMNDVHCGDLCYGDNVIDFKLSPRQWFEQLKNK